MHFLKKLFVVALGIMGLSWTSSPLMAQDLNQGDGEDSCFIECLASHGALCGGYSDDVMGEIEDACRDQCWAEQVKWVQIRISDLIRQQCIQDERLYSIIPHHDGLDIRR